MSKYSGTCIINLQPYRIFVQYLSSERETIQMDTMICARKLLVSPYPPCICVAILHDGVSYFRGISEKKFQSVIFGIVFIKLHV